MKRIIYFLVLIFILSIDISLGISAYSQIKLSFGVRYWPTKGCLNWTAIGHTPDPYHPGLRTPFKSELNWNTNIEMFILNGEAQLAPWLSIDGTYGTGKIQRGICTDTDWLLDYSSSIPFIKTESPSTGNSHFYNFNINLRVLGADSQLGFLDLFTGYGSLSTKTLVTDPLSYVYYKWIYLGGRNVYLGLNSTYEITCGGPRIGIEGNIRPFPFLELRTSVVHLPNLYILGKGYWNLRRWRFRQFGKGSGLEYEFAISIIPVESLSFELGYRNQLLKVANSSDWETCEIEQNGFFISGTYRF